jgi:3-hydroxyacyl-CoA dehydrogenase
MATSTALPPPSQTSASPPLPHGDQHIALIGLGAIGISFLALHLTYTSATISVYDPRPDLQEHVSQILPLYLPSSPSSSQTDSKQSASVRDQISQFGSSGRLRFCTTLREAVEQATIIQEQGPENLAFKQKTWSEVLVHARNDAHLWSSTSGIPAGEQLAHLSSASGSSATDSTLSEETIASARSRLLVVHPFNPPHLMPLLEIVASPLTTRAEQSFATSYFNTSSPLHRPIPVSKEVPGFVANRLSFILFREACNLVASGVCSVAELDEIVRASLGPRWAVGGPFEMYNFGGGKKGLEGFLEIIGGAIDGVWSDSDQQTREGKSVTMQGGDWKKVVIEQTRTAYGVPGPEDVKRRDRGLKEIVGVQESMATQKED